jgi:hypothetical protein
MAAMPLMVKPRVPRRAQRYPVRWPITSLNGQPVQDTWVVDVSTLGARLETTRGMGIRCPVKFTVRLPDGQPREIAGQVVWMRPIFTTPGRFHQGIQFYGPQWDLEGMAKMEQPPK